MRRRWWWWSYREDEGRRRREVGEERGVGVSVHGASGTGFEESVG